MTYSGVFILSDMVTRDLNGEGQPLSEVYVKRPDGSTANVGYFGGGTIGGGSPGRRSLVDKCTFATDTTQNLPGSPISSARYAGAATGDSSQGYFVGGFGPSFSSTVDKMTYADETVANVPGSPMTVARSNLACSTSGTAGYFSGGQWPRITTTDRLTFASDTMAEVPGAALTGFRYRSSGASSSTAGYIGGGYNPPNEMSSTEKITFANETYAVVATAQLSSPRRGVSASGNSTQAYFCGGSLASPDGPVTSVDKLTFSNDTTANAANAGLSIARRGASGTGNPSNGYIGGGEGASPTFSTVDKINYSNDTTAVAANAALSAGRMYTSGLGSKTNALPGAQTFPVQQFTTGIQPGPYVGYSVNGTTPAATQSTVDKLDLATDTSSATTNFVRSGNNAGNLSKVDAGYYCGGSSPEVSLVSKLTFSTDTSAAVSGNITGARYAIGAAGNNTFGYLFAGRNSGAVASTVDKMTYSTETTAAVSTAALTATVYGARAMGNDGVGYVMGGFVPPSWPGPTTIQKITYSTDTRAVLPGTITDVGGRYLAGVANKEDFGYLMGGGTGSGLISSTDKFTLTSETSSLAPSSAELSLVKSAQSAYSNGSTDAYNCGGSNPGGSANYSTCEKITYQTDTRAVVPGGAMSSTRYQVMGFSPRQFTLANPPRPTPTPQTAVNPNGALPGVGFNFGGWTGAVSVTTTQKTTYSSDSTALVPGANQTNDRRIAAAAGDSTNAYIIGGTPGPRSTTDRCVYSTDTTSLIPAQLATPKHAAAAASSFTVSYITGGDNGTNVISSNEKMTFSTETIASFPTNLPAIQRFHAATSNGSTAGYLSGGIPGPISTTLKITYSTESFAALPSTADLSTPKQHLRGFGSPSNGYFCGGITPGGGPNPGASAIDKLNYSNDTMDRLPTTNMSLNRVAMFTTGNPTHGYISGGVEVGVNPANTIMEKFTYSNDTIAVAPGADLVAASSYNCGRGPLQMGLPTTGPTPGPVNC